MSAPGDRAGGGSSKGVGSPPPSTRTCVGCRARRPQSELVRVVRRPDTGTLEIGRALPGRGAWLCAGSTTCVDLAIRRGALTRALRGEIAPGATEALRRALEACARMGGRPHG